MLFIYRQSTPVGDKTSSGCASSIDYEQDSSEAAHSLNFIRP
jgi:hypothetical protein